MNSFYCCFYNGPFYYGNETLIWIYFYLNEVALGGGLYTYCGLDCDYYDCSDLNDWYFENGNSLCAYDGYENGGDAIFLDACGYISFDHILIPLF